MAIVFWDSQGVIYIDYLEKSKTVTGLSVEAGAWRAQW